MNRNLITRTFSRLLVIGLLMGHSGLAQGNIVTVLFSGFNADNPSGMDFMNDTLASNFANDFPSQTYSGQVFGYNQQSEALNFINSHNQVDELFLVGHSWGGNALVQLATNLLLPAGITVDATFQIDSVDIFLGGLGDNLLPPNVTQGFNFYQIATGFLEPEGERDVTGALNINAELFFNDPTISHTSIDNDTRLHELYYANMRTIVLNRTSLVTTTPIPEPMSLPLLVLAASFSRIRKRRLREVQPPKAS